MEHSVKKEITLNRFFVIFLGRAILSLILTGILWACLLCAAGFFHIMSPANAAEQAVSAWCSTLDGHRPITPQEIPAGVDYAFFTAEGTLVQTSLKEESAINTAAELTENGERTGIRRRGASIYLRLITDTQCVVVVYRLLAQFTSPLLRRLFPSADLFFILLLFFMLLCDLLFIAVRYARRLRGELSKLAAAAEQIGRQTLDFETEKTSLLEFNQIMDSLEQLRMGLKQSLGRQWAMEQQKKEQLSALAHDIKTPLAIVSGNAELLLETEQSGEQREYTAFILEHAGQIQRYVTGMIALSRSEGPSGSVCELKELLLSMERSIETLGKKKGISCSLTTENLPDSLPVPEDKLRRILDNLIDNAVQYSPQGGSVFLRAFPAGDMLQLCVQDEGEGFSPQALRLATTEFYRDDESRSSREHFGLGLSIASRIAADLGGTLRLENAPEKGALVTVSLPFPQDMA